MVTIDLIDENQPLISIMTGTNWLAYHIGSRNQASKQAASYAIRTTTINGKTAYQAYATQGYLYVDQTSRIVLPTNGSFAAGGTIDSTSISQLAWHEGWHRSIYTTWIDKTYGAYESWSASYSSNWFDSEGGAITAWNIDMNAAKALAGSQDSILNNAQGMHPADGFVNSSDLWRVHNPNWGATAWNIVNSINLTFSKLPGSNFE